VIVTVPRSGSWNLIEVLNGHPEIIANGEILNPDDTSWGQPDPRVDASLNELIILGFSGLQRRPKTSVTAVGFKVLEDQLIRPPNVMLFLRELAKIKHLRIIVLRRENSLEVLRSTLQATITGQWIVSEGEVPVVGPSLDLSVNQCHHFFQHCDEFFCRVTELFATRAMLYVSYEDLCREPKRTLELIQLFLGATPLPLPPSNLHRQETRPLSVTLSNFEHLKRAFRTTRYHRFFELET
jgi:hypothetical protein